MMWPVYDRLTYINEDGAVEPMLAESWELAEDGSTFTIQLQPEVTFSDGAPLNAEAVKANLERGIREARSAAFKELDSVVSSIDAVDELTVRLNLEGPGGALPFLLGDRAGIMVSPDALDNPDLDQKPVGAGAFVLTQSEPGVRYVYERRDDYWNPDAYQYENLELLVQADDATRLNAVRSGQQDATFIRETQVAEAQAAGLNTISEPRLSFYSLSMNSSRSEFDDARVRQALSKAADRTSINEGIFAGRCPETVQPFPEGYFAHADDLSVEDEWLDHDVEGARALLAEAGLADGFSFTALVPSITGYQTLAQVLQEQFAEVGVTMEIQVVDAAQASTLYNSGSADAVVGSYAGGVDPSVYTASTYLAGPGNPGGLTSPELERLHEEALQSAELEERGEVYEELAEAAFELGPVSLPICFRGGDMAYRDGIEGLKSYVTGTYEFRDVTVTSEG
jgi:peptide/nickel transport system substrate-binding protein